MDYLLHSFLLLMAFNRSSLDYGIIVHILCTYFCECDFLCRQKLKAFLKILIWGKILERIYGTVTYRERKIDTCSKNNVPNVKVKAK